jgi:hypothetical protein
LLHSIVVIDLAHKKCDFSCHYPVFTEFPLSWLRRSLRLVGDLFVAGDWRALTQSHIERELSESPPDGE